MCHMATLYGYVTDNRGNPIENATIAIPGAGIFGLSYSDGYYSIPNISPGTYTVNVVQRNYAKYSNIVAITADVQFNIVL